MPVVRICAEQGCNRRQPASRCPEHKRAQTRRHNAVPQRLAHHSAAYKRLRAQVLSDAGYVCHWCGATATECDFVKPLALGGEMTYSNSVASCKSCNSSRGATVRR